MRQCQYHRIYANELVDSATVDIKHSLLLVLNQSQNQLELPIDYYN
jgi:hypothetical protein